MITRFLYYVLRIQGAHWSRATGISVHIISQDLKEIQIPLPPLEVQKEIVAEIEGYQKVINGARAVLDNYRPHIPIHPDWPMVKLADVCESIEGRTSRRRTHQRGMTVLMRQIDNRADRLDLNQLETASQRRSATNHSLAPLDDSADC